MNEASDGIRAKIEVIDYAKTKKGYGPQGYIGVNYMITKVDKDDKVISRSGLNVKNNAYRV